MTAPIILPVSAGLDYLSLTTPVGTYILSTNFASDSVDCPIMVE